jgi:hypothetical protein
VSVLDGLADRGDPFGIDRRRSVWTCGLAEVAAGVCACASVRADLAVPAVLIVFT